MNLQEITNILNDLENIHFQLENGDKVPAHFHVTEVGYVTRKFIDCGGTIRNQEAINFQLWTANDTDHRLKADKLKSIINLSIDKLELPTDVNIEVEYQGNTIGSYQLAFEEGIFILKNKMTACLAEDACGIPETQFPKITNIRSINTCTPGSVCC